MARAATKRNQRPKQAPRQRTNRGSSSAGIEQTLFFTRLRRQAKWVFVLLVLVFAGGFVFFGVGSGSTGIGDLLNGNFGGIFGNGGSSGPSISKAQARVAKHPKDAAAYKALATAYQAHGDDIGAIGALQQYTNLRPKDTDSLRELASLYDSKAQAERQEAYNAQIDAQTDQPVNFGPVPTTQLGKAVGATPDPIAQADAQAANQRFSAALSLWQSTLKSEEAVYAQIVKADSTDSGSLIQYAQAAGSAGDLNGALAAYKKFVRRFPDDPSVSYAKQQIKTLKKQLAGLRSQTQPTG